MRGTASLTFSVAFGFALLACSTDPPASGMGSVESNGGHGGGGAIQGMSTGGHGGVLTTRPDVDGGICGDVPMCPDGTCYNLDTNPCDYNAQVGEPSIDAGPQPSDAGPADTGVVMDPWEDPNACDMPSKLDGLPDTQCPTGHVTPPLPLNRSGCNDPETGADIGAGEAGGCCYHRCFRGRDYFACLAPLGTDGWLNARDICRKAGMNLMKVDSDAENAFLAWLGKETFGVIMWVGLNNLDDPTLWRWTTPTTDSGPVVMRNGVTEPGAYNRLTLPFSCDECVALTMWPCAWEPLVAEAGRYSFACEPWDGQ